MIANENLPNYLSLMFRLRPPESESPDDLMKGVRTAYMIINILKIVQIVV